MRRNRDQHRHKCRDDAFDFVDIPTPPALRIRRALRAERRRETISMLFCVAGAVAIGIMFAYSI